MSTVQRPLSELRPITISAPFGNYIQPAGCTATLGTFTAAARSGRLWRIIKTVRYYPRLKAWVNKIGLRNPGIDWLTAKCQTGKIDVSDKLVSIHGFTEADWRVLVEKTAALKPLGIELNMSCPNVGHIDWPEWLFDEAVATGVPIVVKVPPVNYRLLVEQAIAAGVRNFHCCNTLPIPAGGMSGQPLRPVALQCIRDILTTVAPSDRDELLIIGGGGIAGAEHIDQFAEAGAKRFAVGTKVFNPKYLFSHAGLTEVIQRAAELAD